MRWKCVVAYDGTDFYGWQSQVGGNTIQDFIERRLETVLKRPCRIHGSGRTDSGVHAKGQVFHFDAEWNHPKEHLLRAFRCGLPRGILIRSVEQVSDDFHARFSATGKRYIYRIYQGWALPQEDRFTLSMENRKLDVERMREGARFLEGTHDFTAFAADRRDGSDEDPVKHLRSIDIRQRGRRIKIIYEGSGFLYKMARSITGALIDVGIGKLSPDDIRRILESRKRTALVVTAPAQGLTLEKVEY